MSGLPLEIAPTLLRAMYALSMGIWDREMIEKTVPRMLRAPWDDVYDT